MLRGTDFPGAEMFSHSIWSLLWGTGWASGYLGSLQAAEKDSSYHTDSLLEQHGVAEKCNESFVEGLGALGAQGRVTLKLGIQELRCTVCKIEDASVQNGSDALVVR